MPAGSVICTAHTYALRNVRACMPARPPCRQPRRAKIGAYASCPLGRACPCIYAVHEVAKAVQRHDHMLAPINGLERVLRNPAESVELQAVRRPARTTSLALRYRPPLIPF